jgi:hypothetical protein
MVIMAMPALDVWMLARASVPGPSPGALSLPRAAEQEEM